MATISPQLPPRKPRRAHPTGDRWKRMPMRDEHGNWAVIIEFRPATNPLVQERFADLARTLYQKWVLEPPPYPQQPATAIAPTPSPHPPEVNHV